MSNSFGTRVTGKTQAEHDAEQSAAAAGKHNFGVRVTGQLPVGANALDQEKANSELGPRVAGTISAKTEDIWLPKEKVEKVLNQNPTFFDSLFEAELARPAGPRKDVLMVLRTVELGPSGGGRGAVIAQIDQHLTGSGQPAALTAREAMFKTEAERARQDEEDRKRNIALRDTATHMVTIPVTSEQLLGGTSSRQQAKGQAGKSNVPLGAFSQPSATPVVGGGTETSEEGSTPGKTGANTGLGSANVVANTGLQNPDLSANTGLSAEQHEEGAATDRKPPVKRAAKKGAAKKAAKKAKSTKSAE